MLAQAINPERRAFRRTERRYRIPDAAVSDLLGKHLGAPDHYRVRTRYYLRRSGKGEHRIRVRHYNDEPTAWVECKRRSDAFVTKRRSKGTPVLTAWQDMGAVTYLREAWERGGVRVTLDRYVTDESGRELDGLVLEVKADRVPRWLRRALPPRAKGFSKRRWMLGETRAVDAHAPVSDVIMAAGA